MRQEKVFYLENLYSAIRLIGIQLAKISVGWSFPHHRHSYFEFLYCQSGELEQWVGGKKYRLGPGDALLIKPEQQHFTSEIHENSVFFNFHFDIELPEIQAIFHLTPDSLLAESGGEAGVRDRAESFIRDFRETLEAGCFGAGETPAAALAYKLEQAAGQLQMHARIVEFISFLARHLLDRSPQPWEDRDDAQAVQLKLAYDAAALLEAAPHLPVPVGELASKLNVHRSYLTFCFKKAFGAAPRDYAMRLRIREAKRLLLEEKESIESLAEHLGFSSAGHFSRTFKAQAGSSPQQFRNRERSR